MNNSLMDQKQFHCELQMNDEVNAAKKPKTFRQHPPPQTPLYEYHTFKLEQVLFALFISSRFQTQGLAVLKSFTFSLISTSEPTLGQLRACQISAHAKMILNGFQ